MSTLTLSPVFTTTGTTTTPRRTRGAGRPAPVRLTRRGRLVVLVACLLAALAVSVLVGAHSTATREGGTPAPTSTVVVGSGDTLWEIAAEVAEPGEVRAMVHRIAKLNALSGSSLQVGQELAVPLG